MKLFLILLFFFIPQQKLKLEYSNGMPTKLGIDNYINNIENQKRFVLDYQNMIKDTLYNDIYFRTETPKTKNSVLAYNVISLNYSCEIVVNDKELYKAFEYDTLKHQPFTDSEYYLKATVFHEITHYYFYQCQIEMQRIKHLQVDQYYAQSIDMFPNQELQYGAKFIEEGLCEYVIRKYKVSPKFYEIYVPSYKADFLNKNLSYEIQYQYSTVFLNKFLDQHIKQDGRIKYAIMILLQNRPPTYEEIMHPQKFFDRLNTVL